MKNLGHIILDYIFIFLFQWGMFGAVIATSMAPLISMAVLSMHKISGRQQFFLKKIRFSSTMITDVLRIGIPSLITEVAAGIVMIIFNSERNEVLQNIAVEGMKLYFMAVPFIGSSWWYDGNLADSSGDRRNCDSIGIFIYCKVVEGDKFILK